MSRKVIYSIVGIAIVLLLAAIAVPNFARSRFHSSGEPISLKIRVVAQDGLTPIQGAEVQIISKRAVTDADGNCDIVHYFPARGTIGRSGSCSLSGTLRVTVQGFSVWEKDLPSLFGKSFDYFNKGNQITYVVTLAK